MEHKVRKVALYGKGGIGKSTIAANISAALSHMGERVMQIGCDPKRDSISTLCGRLMPTLLDQLEGENIEEEAVHRIIHRGYNGVLGVESGGPKPGMGCAGRGVMLALQILEEFNIFEKYNITFALFDVLGDVVCGGFSQPIRAGFAREIYLVACGELLTLLQVSNIAKAVRKLHEQGAETAVAGIINNQRKVPNEMEIVEEFASLLGVPVIHHIPRSSLVQDAEAQGKTVIELFADSDQAQVYRELARKILENDKTFIPNFVSLDDIKPIIMKYSKSLE